MPVLMCLDLLEAASITLTEPGGPALQLQFREDLIGEIGESCHRLDRSELFAVVPGGARHRAQAQSQDAS